MESNSWAMVAGMLNCMRSLESGRKNAPRRIQGIYESSRWGDEGLTGNSAGNSRSELAFVREEMRIVKYPRKSPLCRKEREL
jgi:hypothetical protein